MPHVHTHQIRKELCTPCDCALHRFAMPSSSSLFSTAIDRVTAVIAAYTERIFASPVVANIAAHRYGGRELAAIGASGAFLVFLRCSISGRKLPFGALLWYFWFTCVGVFGAVVDCYYVLCTQSILSTVQHPNNVLDAAWRWYATVDARVTQIDEYFYIITAISCIFSVPLALLIAHAIKRQSPFQYPAQLVASTVLFVCHWILVLSNGSTKFAFADVAANASNAAVFVAHHGVFIVVSFASIVRSLYYCNCSLNNSCAAKQHSK